MNPYLKKYGPGGETNPYDPTTSYIRPKKVNVDGKEMSTYSNEYRNLYNTGNLMPVDYDGIPVMYGPEVEVTAEAPEWLKEKRRIEAQGPVAEAVRKGTGSFARPILETGLELSGVPGAVRFAQDPIKNLQGTANILSYTNTPGLIGHGIDYAMGNPFFNVTEEDWQGLANTADVAGLATLGAGTALKLAPKAVTSIPRMLGKIPDVNPNMGLRFADETIEANKALSTRQRQVVPQTTQSIPKEYTPWTMQEMPGLHIKSTMSGSPFEKQLSKAGELNVNNVQAHINRADVGQQDKYILQKVLNEKFAGKQKVDYNEFRKAVSDELVTLNRVPFEKYQHKLWGVEEIGYPGLKRESYESSIKQIIDDAEYYEKISPFVQSYEKVINNGIPGYKVPSRFNKGNYDIIPEDKIINYLKYESKAKDEFFEKAYPKKAEYEKLLKNIPQVDITTYENIGKFGKGSAKHFKDSTLAHTRTMVDPNQPGIWHTLEQQSDFWQDANRFIPSENAYTKWSEKLAKQEMAIQESMDLLEYMKKHKKTKVGDPVEDYQIRQFEEMTLARKRAYELQKGTMANPQQKEFLGSAHQERLLQENVRLAAEKGMNQVRYPTSETASKIQKYQKQKSSQIITEYNKDLELIENPEAFYKKYNTIRNDYSGEISDPAVIRTLQEYNDNPEKFIAKRQSELERHYKSLSSSGMDDYALFSKEHETVLRKYKDIPKMIEKTLGVKVRTVTDPKGNTWYEFDIPDAYKKGKAEIKAFSMPGIIGAGAASVGANEMIKQAPQNRYGGQNPYMIPKYKYGGPVDPIDPEEEKRLMQERLMRYIRGNNESNNSILDVRSPNEYGFSLGDRFKIQSGLSLDPMTGVPSGYGKLGINNNGFNLDVERKKGIGTNESIYNIGYESPKFNIGASYSKENNIPSISGNIGYNNNGINVGVSGNYSPYNKGISANLGYNNNGINAGLNYDYSGQHSISGNIGYGNDIYNVGLSGNVMPRESNIGLNATYNLGIRKPQKKEEIPLAYNKPIEINLIKEDNESEDTKSEEADAPKKMSYGGPVEPEDKDAAMRGMMKARMALDAELGRNPSALRMTSVSPKEYTFTGNEMFYDEKQNIPTGATGTHYTTGEGNIMFPIIQEGQDGNLFFNRYASPTDKEAMIFETPEEASYFGENYKSIAPMMYNERPTQEDRKIMEKDIRNRLAGKDDFYGISTTKLNPDEEYTYQQWAKGLTPNLKGSMDDKNYDMRGAWQVGEQPELFYYDEQNNFQSAHPIDINQQGSIYEPHLFSRNPFTGKSLKGPYHPTFQHALEGDIKAGGKVKMDLKTGDMYTYKKGGDADSSVVEIERSERVYTPDGNLIMETPADAPTHEEGGVKVRLPAGSLVFPKKYYKALDAASGLPEFKKIAKTMLDNAEKAYLRGEPFSSGGKRQ